MAAQVVSAYDLPAADATFYPGATYDPPRPFNPYVSMMTASSAGVANTGVPQIPVIGLLIVGAVILLLHHLHLRASAGAGGSV